MKHSLSRRTFLKSSLGLSAATMLGSAFTRTGFSEVARTSSAPALQGWCMPAEWTQHKRCWMSWPARKDIWDVYRRPLEDVRKDIASIARAIAQFEPVVMAVCPGQQAEAERLCGPNVSFFEVMVDDLWIRDTGPTFLVNSKNGVAGSSWTFNGWGNKPEEAGPRHANDSELAGRILQHLDVPQFEAPIVLEGGALEVDGEGTLICTETSILNPNRNPGMNKERATEVLQGWLGVKKVIWLPDTSPDPGTDGHIDGCLKFTRPGVVLFELSSDPQSSDYKSQDEMLKYLENQTDAHGRKFEVIKLYQPMKHAEGGLYFSDSYVNCYLANGGLVSQKFGDPERDEAAYKTLSQAYPDRKVIQLLLDTLSCGGGSIHCSTQQEPLPVKAPA